MAEELDLELRLRPYDPWVIKKNLTETDLHYCGTVILPKQDFEVSICSQMEPCLVANLDKGVEVKVHIVEEGPESDDYTLMLLKCNNGSYMLRGGWYNMAKAKGYKPKDEIGLMWDKWSTKFFFHHIK